MTDLHKAAKKSVFVEALYLADCLENADASGLYEVRTSAELRRLHAENNKLREALAAPVVPEGYALVPVEPTPEMLMAGYEAQGEATVPAVLDAYRAMLAAAPKPKEQTT